MPCSSESYSLIPHVLLWFNLLSFLHFFPLIPSPQSNSNSSLKNVLLYILFLVSLPSLAPYFLPFFNSIFSPLSFILSSLSALTPPLPSFTFVCLLFLSSLLPICTILSYFILFSFFIMLFLLLLPFAAFCQPRPCYQPSFSFIRNSSPHVSQYTFPFLPLSDYHVTWNQGLIFLGFSVSLIFRLVAVWVTFSPFSASTSTCISVFISYFLFNFVSVFTFLSSCTANNITIFTSITSFRLQLSDAISLQHKEDGLTSHYKYFRKLQLFLEMYSAVTVQKLSKSNACNNTSNEENTQNTFT